MMEIFTYDFMQNAMIAGILVSFCAGIVGSLIVVNRMVFLAGGIAHSSYGGIGMALYLGIPIFLGAGIFAALSALLIAWLTIEHRERIDSFIGLIWAVGMAIGVLFTDITPGYHSDLMSYLFGSILAVSKSDLYAMALLLAVILLLVHRYYREILAVSYDSQYASLRGIPSRLVYTMLLLGAAMTVVVSIKVVGLILVIALMTIPTYIAERVTRSLYSMMIVSGILAAIFTLCGLLASYIFDLTSGASIILVSATGLMVYFVVSAIYRRILYSTEE
jgi:zinc transport system permease protein